MVAASFGERFAASAAVPAERARFLSLDVARGLVVAIMALDHARMYFTAAGFDPTDLARTTPAYFLTRWVTHLCAPWFFVIAGLGAGLQRDRGGAGKVARFLVSRGLWLIFIELTLLGIFWSFEIGWWWFGVIFSLGASFCLLAIVSRIAPRWLVAASLVFILVGPFIEQMSFAQGSAAGQIFKLLYAGGLMKTGLFGSRIVLFPVLPWFAMMALGYGASPWVFKSGEIQVQRLWAAGSLLLALFVLLRVTGIYGEAHHQPLSSWLAFLNVQKYPPSLHFSLLEIGLLAMILAAIATLERDARLGPLSILAPYGKAPFAFYCAHIGLIHCLALVTAAALNWDRAYLFWTRVGPNLRPPPGYGFDLPGVYLVWLTVLALLYPLCVFVTRWKRSNPAWWLRYL